MCRVKDRSRKTWGGCVGQDLFGPGMDFEYGRTY